MKIGVSETTGFMGKRYSVSSSVRVYVPGHDSLCCHLTDDEYTQSGISTT